MPSIQLVETDAAQAEAVAAAFRAQGAEVEVIVDPKDAIERITARAPDLVLLRIELGGVSGYSICNRLKKGKNTQPIPLVLLSSEANADTFQQHQRLKTRAEQYIHLPCAPDSLVEQVRPLLPKWEPEHHDVDIDVHDPHATLDPSDIGLEPLELPEDDAPFSDAEPMEAVVLAEEASDPRARVELREVNDEAIDAAIDNLDWGAPSAAAEPHDEGEHNGKGAVRTRVWDAKAIADSDPAVEAAIVDEPSAGESSQLREQIELIMMERDALAKRVDEAEADRVALSAEAEAAASELRAVRKQLEELSADLADARAERDRNRGDLEELRGERDRFAAEREQFASERQQLAGERDALVGERDQLTVDRDLLTGERNELAEERDRLRSEFETAQSDRERLTAECDQARSEREQARSECDQAQTERDQVVAELEQVRAERDLTAAERDRLTAERDEIRDAVQALLDRLS